MFASISRICGSLLALTSLLPTLGNAAPAVSVDHAERAAEAKYVFAHFMIGIVADRTSAADYDADIQRAKALGIDAFALNIGVDGYTDQQLDYAYQSAANNNFKVFISFDFNWYATSQGTTVGQKVAQYASRPAQFKYNNAVFVSSFAGDGLDVQAMRNAAGTPVFFVPNFHPGQGDFSAIDGALNWMAWPNNGNNKAPTPGHNVTVEQGDDSYMSALAGKPYLAPASPWFYTHYGPEVSYSKNWVFPGDLLWYNRWTELLTMAPAFIEIVHNDDGASKWVNDMPHDGWLDLAKPFIAAYHAGATKPDAYITSDQLIYWYRPQPATENCDATDTTMVPANNGSGNYFMGRPDGYQTLAESVFVVALLKSAGIVHINSGSNSQSFNAPAGASSYSIPMGVGKQSFALERNGAIVIGQTSNKDIIDGCVCGLYNFNAYVGTVPQAPPFPDQLQPDGLNLFNNGLKVSTCQPTPSLGTTTIPYSGSATGAPTTTTSTTSKSTSTTTTAGTTTTTSKSTTTTSPTQTTTATTTTSTGTCKTITASSQIAPTNCLRGCDVWKGPAGSDPPDHCDGS